MKNYFFALSLAVATLSTLPAFAGSFTVTAESGTTSTIDVTTLSLSNELSVRRAIQYDGYYYVLAYDGEDTQSPIILKVNPLDGEFTSISTSGITTDGYSSSSYSKSMNWVISDIGITDDGYLVAINSVVIGGTDREEYVTGDFYMYIWASGTESTPTATKLIDAYNSSTTVPLAGSNQSNLIGNTFAINGSLEDGFYFYTTSHPMSDSSNYWSNGNEWQTRFICYYVTVSDGTATISKSYRTYDADTNSIEITDSYDEDYDWPWLGETDMVTYLTGSESSAPVLVFDGIGNATMSVELTPSTGTDEVSTTPNMDFTILLSTAISDYDTGDPSFIYVSPNVYMITPTLISSTGSYVSTSEDSSDESDGTETTFTQNYTSPTIEGTASRRIYAYGLSATESDDGSYTLRFSTNITPSDFAINLYAADADGGYPTDPTRTIYKGDLTYTESSNTYSVTITEAIAGSMNKFRWSVTVYAAAIESFTQVSASASSGDDGFDQDLVFYAPYGVAVDNSPESPYFGTVYVGNAGGCSTSSTSYNGYNARSAGIYRFDPTDESKDPSDSGQASGYFSSTFTGSDATRGLKALDVASDGRLFATLYSTSATGIFYVSPDMLSATSLSSLSTKYNIGISLRETSSDTELFLIDYTGTYNTVANYTLGSDNTLTLGSVSATMEYGSRFSNIATTATGYFVNQGSGDSSTSKYSGLFYYDDSYTDDSNTTATTALASSSSSDRGAVAVYEEENLVAYSLGGNLYLSYYTYSDDGTSVTLSNFDSENEYYTASALGSYACAFDFDYAGNLYAVSSAGECLAVYAIPTSDNSCTTFATAGADEKGYILDFTEGAEYVYTCTYGVGIYNVTNGLESAAKISEAEVVITDDTDPSESYISASAEANNLGSAMTVYLLVNDQVFVTTSDSETASTISLPATRRIFAYDLRATLDDTEKQYDYTDSQTGKTVTKKSNGGEFYTLSFKTNTLADYVTVNLYKVTQGTTTDDEGNSIDDGTVQSVASEPTMTYTFTDPVSTSFVLEAHALSEGATSDIEEESEEESEASEEGSSSDSSDVNYGYLYELGGDDYTWEVIAHAGPVVTFTESSQTSEELNIYAPYGIVCNTNPETDEFGDVYVANIQVGTTTDYTRITDNGIYIFEADDTPRYLRTDENFSYYNASTSETVSGSAVLGYKGGITWPGNYCGSTTSYYTGWSQRLCLSSDGKRLFMNDRSHKQEMTINGETVTFNSTGVYEIDPTTFATRYAADEDVEMSNIFSGLESETVTETDDNGDTTTYAKLFIDTDSDGELDDDETVVAGSMVAIGIRGDEDNVQLYGIDKSTTGFTTTVTNIEVGANSTTSTVRLLGIRRYDIGSNSYNSESPWNTQATYTYDLSGKTDDDADGYDDTDNTLLAGIVNGNANMVIVEDGIWAAQYRYANRATIYTPTLLYYSEDDNDYLTATYESSELDASEDFSTLELTSNGTTYIGYTGRNGALAVNESENLIAQAFNYGVRLMYYSFDSSGSDAVTATASETGTTSTVPTITSYEWYDTPAQGDSGSNSYAFDYAGNLYATSSSAEYVSVYGIPMPVDEETGETAENQKTITPNESNRYIGFSVSDLASGVIDNLADANQTATAKVYPNPATSDVTIECGDEITSIVIYNLGTGAQVINLAGNGATTATVDVDGLASGLYVVKINGSIAKKLLVK